MERGESTAVTITFAIWGLQPRNFPAGQEPASLATSLLCGYLYGHGRRLEATLRPRQAHPQRTLYHLRPTGAGRASARRRSCRGPSHGRLPARSRHPVATCGRRRRPNRHPRALCQPPAPPPRIRRRPHRRTPRLSRTLLVSSTFRAKTSTGRPPQIPAPPSQSAWPSEPRTPTLELASHPVMSSRVLTFELRDCFFKKRMKPLDSPSLAQIASWNSLLPSPFFKMCYRYPLTP
jgi:hypothetical protein